MLEIRTEARYDLYDLDIEIPAPLVPRRWRLGVPERVLADGEVRRPLDVDAVRDAAKRLADDGVTSVAISFLNSYRWPEHERLAAEVAAEACPELDITTSAEVLPEMREYARTATTVANAYVRPLARRYLLSLATRIAAIAPNARLSLVASTGCVTPARTAIRTPIRLLESGPAGGVLAAVRVASNVGIDDCLAFDMGGTTAKASYVLDGRPRLTSSFEVARIRRFVRGSGLPVQVPSIELIEIGAGGGSVAWVDRLGLLRVGPRSSGSEPGPACYGRGGAEPTVTDADLLLGHLDSYSFLGGAMVLDVDAARRALDGLARVVGLTDADEAAAAVRRVVDEQMAAAARMLAVEQGLDTGRFTLVATGGAGPVHACSVARTLRIPLVLMPARAGVASAHGFLGAAHGFHVARSSPSLLADVEWPAVRTLLADLAAEAAEAAAGAGGTRRVEADLRFRGQGDTVTVAVDESVVAAGDYRALESRLTEEYGRLYGRVPEGVPTEVLTWRVSVSGREPPLLPMGAGKVAATGRTRRVWFEEAGGYVDTAVLGRHGATGDGPMVVEERESTLVVPPGATVRSVEGGALLVELVHQ